MTEQAEFVLYLSISTVLIGLIVAVIVCWNIVRKYKKGLQSPIYPLEHYANLDLTHSQDNFIGRTVTKVKVSSSKKKR